MVSADEFERSLAQFPPVIATALLRLALNRFRDRDDWEVAVQKEAFLEDLSIEEFDGLFEILGADIRMWLAAPQRSADVEPPLEFILCRNPFDPIGHLTRARAIRAPYG